MTDWPDNMPAPDWQSPDGAVRLYRADCLELLPQLPDGCVGLLLTDPPYGMKYSSGWRSRRIHGDEDTAARDALLSMWSGPALVFGRWNCPRPRNVRARLIWNKGDWPGMGDLSFPWGPSDEEIYVIGDGFSGRRTGTILSHDRLTGDTLHPNEKPVPLLVELIGKTAPSAIILDPFLGSGTTAVACIRTGRRCIGVEIDEQYFNIAVKRCEAEYDNLWDRAQGGEQQLALTGDDA